MTTSKPSIEGEERMRLVVADIERRVKALKESIGA